MLHKLKSHYKAIFNTIGILLIGIAAAFLFEENYRQLVRSLFKLIQGDKIQFVGKNFQMFASKSFVYSFGVFTSIVFLALRFSSKNKRLIRLFITLAIFFITTILICTIDSYRLIIECTACDGGVRNLTFDQLNYNRYFILSLILSLCYLLFAFFLEQKVLAAK
jgi:hypothetical protein